MKSLLAIPFAPALAVFAALLPGSFAAHAKDTPAETNPVPVRMTVTATVDNGKRMPEILKEDVTVMKRKERLPVTDWVPAAGDRAGLELFILIDDASDSSLGNKISELRDFINAQPETTSVGVGYAASGSVQIVQNFTTDHTLAAKSVRLPLGYPGAFGSPYLSVTDLMKRWPDTTNRREVILVGDGIDRAQRGRNALSNPDVDYAGEVAQRTGTMIHTIYTPGAGHWRRNFWEANYGANGLAKLSAATGGESFFLSLQSPVSFKPYLDRMQTVLANQYLITLAAAPVNKAGLQYVDIGTEIAGVDLNAADAVWVPGVK